MNNQISEVCKRQTLRLHFLRFFIMVFAMFSDARAAFGGLWKSLFSFIVFYMGKICRFNICGGSDSDRR